MDGDPYGSGPPSTKTVTHSLIKAFSYLLQSLCIYLQVFFSIGIIFKSSLTSFITEHTELACAIASPTWIILPILLYIFYLSTSKLLIAVKPNLFLSLDHEVIALRLQIVAVFITIITLTLDAVAFGSFCYPKFALGIYNGAAHLGIESGTFGRRKTPLLLILGISLITLSVLEQFTGEVILYFKRPATLS